MTSVENKEESAKISDIHETISKTPWWVQAETRYWLSKYTIQIHDD